MSKHKTKRQKKTEIMNTNVEIIRETLLCYSKETKVTRGVLDNGSGEKMGSCNDCSKGHTMPAILNDDRNKDSGVPTKNVKIKKMAKIILRISFWLIKLVFF